MNAQAADSTRRIARPQTRLVIVRANGPFFYSTAAASLLEALAGSRSSSARWRCLRATKLFPPLDTRGQWLPRKAERARALRAYVEETWPEFDWQAAYEHYRARSEQNGGTAPHRATTAHEALASCISAAQTALFYRSLARWSDDHRLRAMASVMAQEDADCFGHFRAAFDRRARSQRVGIVAALRTTRACVRSARDVAVRFAFEAIAAHCAVNVPFPLLDYREFLQRMQAVVRRCGQPARVERLLFQPWTRTPPASAEQPKQPLMKWFRPVLAQAA